ncbi:MFS transporter [Steroidobacter sp.]|uniref:MFS transporter n=1 Tax=Steroidobacter sp. TaxID=1978227 RepID=UPI001A5624CE|nr:MFS transporter [Steroidobacter sp.]MBL8268330.1 MFS transporter [Steroidobacter sp.]
MIFGYIVAYLDRVNVGFAKLQMLDDLQFSETVYGLGAGIFFIGYFLLEVPSNMMLYRLGARLWIARIMITWGMLSAATLFVTTPAEFYTVRFLLGAAEAGFFPGIIYYLTNWYPARLRSRITAAFMTGIAISGAIGSALSGWIMQTFDGLFDLSGWQWMFLIEAIPAVLLGVCVLYFLDDRIDQARWLSAREKQLLEEDLRRDADTTAAGSSADAFRDARVWFACLIYFCAVTGLYGIGFWLPTIIAELGIEQPLRIGLWSAVPYTVAAIAMVLAGRSADRHDERRWHVAIPAFVGALALTASVMLGDQPAAALAALTVATAGILCVPPLFWSIPTAYLRGAAAAAGIAIINSFGNLAGFVSPYAIGWIKDTTHSTAAGMYLVAGFVCLSGILVIVGVPTRNRLRTPD